MSPVMVTLEAAVTFKATPSLTAALPCPGPERLLMFPSTYSIVAARRSTPPLESCWGTPVMVWVPSVEEIVVVPAEPAVGSMVTVVVTPLFTMV